MLNREARNEMTRSSWDEGVDFDWALSHGAEMLWSYCNSVQSGLSDIEAAYSSGDWPTCLAACAATLRALAFSEYRGAGMSATFTESELQLRLATDPSAAASALRALPEAVSADQDDADAAIELVHRCDAHLQQKLPFTAPILRSATGSTQSMRLAASITKWRNKRQANGGSAL
jgi:hypothetical protein